MKNEKNYQNNQYPKTQKEAKELGYHKYYTGKPCKNNHLCPRYTTNTNCFECVKRFREKRIEKDADYEKKVSRRYYLKNKQSHSKKNRQWQLKNKEKAKIIKSRWQKKNRHKINEENKRKQKIRIVNDPLFRLNKNISKEIWAFMRGHKQGKTWKLLVEASLEEIKPHLESKFTEKMSWDNYGSFWEIDHIIPLSHFYHLPIEDAVREAWKLDNLQPLEVELNRAKCNRNKMTRDEIIKSLEEKEK